MNIHTDPLGNSWMIFTPRRVFHTMAQRHEGGDLGGVNFVRRTRVATALDRSLPKRKERTFMVSSWLSGES